jgi:hypothetical protein
MAEEMPAVKELCAGAGAADAEDSGAAEGIDVAEAAELMGAADSVDDVEGTEETADTEAGVGSGAWDGS